jgi:hypothetical protein
MQTLYSLRQECFSHICLPHTADLNPASIVVDGKPKLEDYIKYREDRDKAIIDCFVGHKDLTMDQLYEAIYGSRGLEGRIKEAALRNLDLHLGKLIKEGMLSVN